MFVTLQMLAFDLELHTNLNDIFPAFWMCF